MRGHRACHHLEMGNLRMRSVKGKDVTGKQKWNVFKRWMENQGCLKKEVIVRCYFSVTESYFLPYKALFSFPTLPLDSLSPPVPSSTEEKSRLHAIFFSHTLPVCSTATAILFLPWLVRLQVLNRDYARSFMPREPTHPTRPYQSLHWFWLVMWIFLRVFSTCWKISTVVLVDTNIKKY